MMSVKIVSDSACDIPKELADELVYQKGAALVGDTELSNIKLKPKEIATINKIIKRRKIIKGY